MSGGNQTAAAILRAGIEQIEEIDREIKLLQAERSAKKKALTGEGFDGKVVTAILRERKMDESDRLEFNAILQVYRAALGMLDDTPLGQAARERFMKKKPDEDPPGGDGDRGAGASDDQDPAPDGAEPDGGEADADEPATPPKRTLTQEDISEARQLGAEAAKAGVSILKNPFTAKDPRRASWDEGWCSATGSDGMDVPEAWRRSKPKKAKKPDGEGGE